MMVAIGIITVVMAALTSLFSGTIKTTNHFRAQQSGIVLATAALDQARSIGAVDAALGRDKTSVDAQFASFAGTPVASWLTSMDPVYGDASYEADLPTSPVTQTVGSATYEVSYLVGSCHRKFSYAADSADCTNGARDASLSYIDFVRVVVAVSWEDASCDGGRCYQVSAVLLNGDEDPLFSLNSGTPPEPKVNGCRDQEIILGDYIEIPIFGVTQADEEQPLCDVSGGVPPFAWTASPLLPDGLDIVVHDDNLMPYVEGTVGGATGTIETALTVSDAYSHSATSEGFIWTIIDPQPTIDDIGDQRTRVGESFTLPVTYTCPVGTCTFSLGEPSEIEQAAPPVADPDEETPADPDGDDPDGDDGDDEPADEPEAPTSPVTIDPETGELSGTAPDLNTVVRGLTVTITGSNGKSDTTEPFDWEFTDGPVLPAIPDQVGIVGDLWTFAVGGDCGGHGTCTYSVAGPGWLPIDSTGVLSGTAPSVGDYSVTVTLKDSTGDSDSATFTVTVYDKTAIGTIDDQDWTVGTEINPMTVSVACGRAPCAFEPASGLPKGVDFDVDTGEISGTPENAGSGTAQISVTDGGGEPASTSFSWLITEQTDVIKNTGKSRCITASGQIASTTTTCTTATGWVITPDNAIRVGNTADDCLIYTTSGSPSKPNSVLIGSCSSTNRMVWVAANGLIQAKNHTSYYLRINNSNNLSVSNTSTTNRTWTLP